MIRISRLPSKSFTLTLFAVLAMQTPFPAGLAQETPAEAPAATAPSASTQESVTAENQPYDIVLHLSVDDRIALDAATGERVLADFESLADRIVGRAWNLDARWAEGDVWDTAFDLWTQWPEPVTYDRRKQQGGEKVWLVRLRPGTDKATIELVGREFDRSSGILGPVRTRPVLMTDLARGIFELSRDIFRAIADVAGYEGGEVRLRIRGASLAAVSEGSLLAQPGQYYQLVRLFYDRTGKFVSCTVEPWTYVKTTKVTGDGAFGALLSSFRDPIGRRYRQTNKLVAMALTPSTAPTTFRFAQLLATTGGTPIRHPVAGHKVEIHEWPTGPVRATALTDREGTLRFEPPEGLDFFGVRLVGGSLEPLLDVPVLAGDQVPAILADAKPAAVEFQQRLIAYRDEILDALARRFVIEARLGDRTKASDWARVTELVREWRSTPVPTGFTSTLAQWKMVAQRRQLQEKKAIYTQANQALMAELEALASRYEGQEIEVYEESLEKRSNLPYLQDLEDQSKEKAKAKSTP